MKPQTTYGDKDPRQEHSLAFELTQPVRFWTYSAAHDGIDTCAWGPLDWDYYTESIGVTDTNLDYLASTLDRSNVHIYKDAYLNELDVKKGTAHVMPYGYVSQLYARNDSVVHVSGHVGGLTVLDNAQVFLYAGCYVDSLLANEGVTIIHDSASVHYLHVEPIAKCLLAKEAKIYYTDDRANKICLFVDTPAITPVVRVRIDFGPYKESFIHFCKDFTEQYQKYGAVKMGSISLWQIHHCVHDCEPGENEVEPNVVEFCADCVNNKPPTLNREIRQCISITYGIKPTDITIWYRGSSDNDPQPVKL